jgi:hypothetical protein
MIYMSNIVFLSLNITSGIIQPASCAEPASAVLVGGVWNTPEARGGNRDGGCIWDEPVKANQGCTRLHKATQGYTRLHKAENFPPEGVLRRDFIKTTYG